MKYSYHTTALRLCTVALLSACSGNPQGGANDIAIPVSTMELKKGSIRKLINANGTARPVYGADLTAQMSGNYMLRINPQTGNLFKLGDKVTKGQLIISLEDREYVNNIALDAKELDLEIAQQEQSKQTALYEKGGVTLSEMRNTEVKATNARHAVENARINLQKMDIRSPFDGFIVDLPHYTPGVKVEQGKPMVSLMDYALMYLEVNLPESAIGYVKAGQSVFITHYTLPEDTLQGVINELSPAVSAETRTFKGKIVIRNDALLLRPGMFVRADIMVDRADSAIVVPKEAIQTNRNRKYVYVVEKNTALVRDIKTALEDETHVQVTEGLNENDNLVIEGFEILRENSKIKVQR